MRGNTKDLILRDVDEDKKEVIEEEESPILQQHQHSFKYRVKMGKWPERRLVELP